MIEANRRGVLLALAGIAGASILKFPTLAAAAELSPYEILTGLRLRLPRRYVGEEQVRAVAAARMASRTAHPTKDRPRIR